MTFIYWLICMMIVALSWLISTFFDDRLGATNLLFTMFSYPMALLASKIKIISKAGLLILIFSFYVSVTWIEIAFLTEMWEAAFLGVPLVNGLLSCFFLNWLSE